MVRYKMLGRDINSDPLQYRTWVVADQPDFVGDLYTGLKSGDSVLEDVSANYIGDGYDGYSVDFSLPLPLNWNTTKRVLPDIIYNSQLAILDGYAYLFGGELNDKIYRADLNNPATWSDTGSTLPGPLGNSQLGIIDGYMYLFGGNDGYVTNVIYKASVSDPLTWLDTGSFLPSKLQDAQLFMDASLIYLFGGEDESGATNTIFAASTSSPLTWADTGFTLPNNLMGSHIGQADGYIYLYGGRTSTNVVTTKIYRALTTLPTTWAYIDDLPFPMSYGQFFSVGSKGYLIAPVSPTTPTVSFTKILRCDLDAAYHWVDTLQTIPGEVSQSQVGIIGDRVFFFGGNGSTVIFACEQKLKYVITYTPSVEYGNITRTIFNATDNASTPFSTLGFPYWKANY